MTNTNAADQPATETCPYVGFGKEEFAQLLEDHRQLIVEHLKSCERCYQRVVRILKA